MISKRIIVYYTYKSSLFINLFVLTGFLALTISNAFSQKQHTAEWIKSTNCFTGFSSQVIITKPDKKKYSYLKKPINSWWEYTVRIRNDYDRVVNFAMTEIIAGKQSYRGVIKLTPGEIFTESFIRESPSDSVKIRISGVCFNAQHCIDYSVNGNPWPCYAECDIDNKPNTPAHCGNIFSNPMKSGNYSYINNFASHAIETYESCWSYGHDTAALFLGYVYLKQWEREKEIYNPAKARAYFDTALLNGNTTALYAIGQMYEHGLGVAKDIPLAISYYEKGATKENGCCVNALVLLYSGNADYKDPEKAKRWKELMDYLRIDKKQLICRPEDYYDRIFTVIN